jgi:hypothetical protein
MIARIWHGRVPVSKSNEYLDLPDLLNTAFPQAISPFRDTVENNTRIALLLLIPETSV